MSVLLLLAFMLAAPVTAPSGYERAWATIPERHRLLVRSIQVDRVSSAQARPATMSIHLTPHRGKRSDVSLVHEVCHIISYAHPAIEHAWQSRFWVNDRPSGLPPTQYARTNPDEDFAVSCEKAQDGDGPDDPARAAFFRQHGIWP